MQVALCLVGLIDGAAYSFWQANIHNYTLLPPSHPHASQ